MSVGRGDPGLRLEEPTDIIEHARKGRPVDERVCSDAAGMQIGRHDMRGAPLLIAALLVSVLTGYATQSSDVVTGRVVNRDGAGLPRCVIEFRVPKAAKPLYSAYSDARGYFSLKRPKPGEYAVTVVQGTRKYSFPKAVRITDRGLTPAVLVVPW